MVRVFAMLGNDSVVTHHAGEAQAAQGKAHRGGFAKDPGVRVL